MTYHANHSWCSESCWNDKMFDSEAMVYFSRRITLTDILENNSGIELFTKIINPDFEKLAIEETVFNEKKYNKDSKIFIENILKYKKVSEEEILKIKEDLKETYFDLVPTLKPEIIDWLNENIKDEKNPESDEIQDKKGWCIGNDSYRGQANDITIFFKRELDALRFIREWSVFKEPVFYFDYFSDDRRNMDLNKLIYILKENDKLNIEEVKKIELDNKNQGNINLDPLSFRLLDWEKDEESDDISLDDNEIKEFVKELYKNENVDYKENNIVEYEKIFELKNTEEKSLGYEINGGN